MILTETIPSVVTWPEIRNHCRLDDNEEQSYLMGLADACTQAFEKETGIAIGQRTATISYSSADLCRYSLPIPKGPVISVNQINGLTASPTDYELNKVGHTHSIRLKNCGTVPATLTLTIGFVVVPQLIKQAILIHLESWKNNRGATSSQQQYVNELGLERIYNLFKVNKVVT